jgi:hypothetical protein
MARNPYFPWKSVPSMGIHSLFKAENAGFGLLVLWLRWFAGGEVDRGRSIITQRDDGFVPIPLPNPSMASGGLLRGRSLGSHEGTKARRRAWNRYLWLGPGLNPADAA